MLRPKLMIEMNPHERQVEVVEKELLSARSKENLQQGTGILGEKAGNDVDMVVEFRRSEYFEAGAKGAAFWVIRSIDDAWDACLNDSAGAHGARLEGDVQSSVGEAVVAQKVRGFANHDNLGVRGGIVIADGAIAGTRNYIVFVNKDSANGDFTGIRGSLCFAECELHEMQIVWHRRKKDSTAPPAHGARPRDEAE